METSSKNAEVVFNKYYPQHPLPKEIQDLPSKETVCEFCGISYLIHSEIKRLEEEILLLNKKLKSYEELKLSENNFEMKYKNLIVQQQHDHLKYLSLEENLNIIKNERDELHIDMRSKGDKIIKLESSLEILKNNKQKMTSKHKIVFQKLFDLHRKNEELKDKLISVKNEINLIIMSNQKIWNADSAMIIGAVDRLKDYYKIEIQNHEFHIHRLDSEIILLKDDIKEKSQQRLNVIENNNSLSEKYKQLLQNNNLLEHELRDKISIISEKDQLIVLLNKEKEEKKILKENDNQKYESQIFSMNEKIKTLEESLIQEQKSNKSYQEELENLRIELGMVSLNNNELSSRLSIYEEEIHILKDSIEKAAGYKLSIAKENETTIVKLKEELDRLNSELIFSKQVEQEIKIKMQKEVKTQNKIYEEEINVLKIKISTQNELQQRLNEKEKELIKMSHAYHQLNDDNIQLKTDLQRMDNTKNINQMELERLSSNNTLIQNLEDEITIKEKIIDRMEENLIINKNEIYSLQQTIQKECEERQELTESLNRAREQLLVLGEFNLSKSLVNLPPIQKRNSGSSIISGNSNSSQCSMKPLKPNQNNSIILTKRKLERLFNT